MLIVNQNNPNPEFNPSLLGEELPCDLCSKKHDFCDLIPCPEGNGYYCPECFNSGEVVSYLKRMHKYNQVQINNFLKRVENE